MNENKKIYFTEDDSIPAVIRVPEYIKYKPYVGDDGIYIPIDEYILDIYTSKYRMVMSKEMFVEAYNKWIKGEN